MTATRKPAKLRIHVDGGGAYGDLFVDGFESGRTALEVGADFADVLRRRYPAATVQVWLGNDETVGEA